MRQAFMVRVRGIAAFVLFAGIAACSRGFLYRGSPAMEFSQLDYTVPTQLSRIITQRLAIPTIGIGAGTFCDGQVQVLHDMMGMFTDFVPKHAKRYANLGEAFKEATARYIKEVQEGAFPTEKESFSMDESVLAEMEAVRD